MIFTLWDNWDMDCVPFRGWMGKTKYLSDFEIGEMAVCARFVSGTAMLLGFSHSALSCVYQEWCTSQLDITVGSIGVNMGQHPCRMLLTPCRVHAQTNWRWWCNSILGRCSWCFVKFCLNLCCCLVANCNKKHNPNHGNKIDGKKVIQNCSDIATHLRNRTAGGAIFGSEIVYGQRLNWAKMYFIARNQWNLSRKTLSNHNRSKGGISACRMICVWRLI